MSTRCLFATARVGVRITLYSTCFEVSMSRRPVDLFNFYVDDDFLLSFDPVKKRVCVNSRVLPFVVNTIDEALEVLAAFNQADDESDEVFNEKVKIRIWTDTEIPF